MILLSLVLGFVWVLIYRLIGLFRRFLGRGKAVCMMEDFFLAIIFAVSTYMFMYNTCDGLVRGYNYIALTSGILCGVFFIGKLRTAYVVRMVKKQLKQERETLTENKG